MKNGVERTVHPNGQIAGEVTYMNGLPNGVTRRWYPNGVLASQYSVKDGNYEGVSKQWNEKGELLGSFEITDGTGTIKMWYPNGQIMSEISMLKGKWTGLHRGWFEGGTPLADQYYIENRKVSKKKYLAACKENPAFPRYEELEASAVSTFGKTRKESALRPAKTTQVFRTPEIEGLLNSAQSKEALAWLQGGKRKSRTLGELPTTAASIELVKEVYALGAKRVLAVNIATYDTGDENTGKLIVSLPEGTGARARVFAWCAEQAEQLGFEAECDEGQEHVFVMLD